MLELQQQLCDAEADTERMREQNAELATKVETLEVQKEQVAQWRKAQVMRCFLYVEPDFSR